MELPHSGQRIFDLLFASFLLTKQSSHTHYLLSRTIFNYFQGLEMGRLPVIVVQDVMASAARLNLLQHVRSFAFAHRRFVTHLKRPHARDAFPSINAHEFVANEAGISKFCFIFSGKFESLRTILPN